MEVTLRVGKDGLDSIVQEARDQLESRDRIKVKVNQPLVEGRMRDFTEGVAEELAVKTDARVVWVKGRTFVLEAE